MFYCISWVGEELGDFQFVAYAVGADGEELCIHVGAHVYAGRVHINTMWSPDLGQVWGEDIRNWNPEQARADLQEALRQDLWDVSR